MELYTGGKAVAVKSLDSYRFIAEYRENKPLSRLICLVCGYGEEKDDVYGHLQSYGIDQEHGGSQIRKDITE